MSITLSAENEFVRYTLGLVRGISTVARSEHPNPEHLVYNYVQNFFQFASRITMGLNSGSMVTLGYNGFRCNPAT